MAAKKGMELDTKLQAVVDGEFAEFERYLPTPQDVAMYRRKRKEYWEKIATKLKEEANTDGRADSTQAN